MLDLESDGGHLVFDGERFHEVPEGGEYPLQWDPARRVVTCFQPWGGRLRGWWGRNVEDWFDLTAIKFHSRVEAETWLLEEAA